MNGSGKNIGIIGAGAIALSTAIHLKQRGNNITVFKRDSQDFSDFQKITKNEGISIELNPEVENEIKKTKTKIDITNNINDLSNSDVIIISTNYWSHTSDMGELIKQIGLRNNVPIIISPGKFNSLELCEIISDNVSEVSGAVFGALLNTDGKRNITVSIKNRKSELSISIPKNKNIDILTIMNNLYGKDKYGKNTFGELIDPQHLSLQSHDSSISSVALCDNLDEIINSKGKIELNLYALSEEYSEIFDGIFKERQEVAKKLGFKLTPIHKLLGEEDYNISTYQLLQNKFSKGEFKTPIDIYDRRFIEDTLALQKFIEFSEKNGVNPVNSKKIISKLLEKKELKHLPIFKKSKKIKD